MRKIGIMQKVSILLLLPVLVWIIGCGPAEKEVAEQKAWDYMMSIHDEVMPRMSEINSLAKSVQSITADSTTSMAVKAEGEKQLEALSEADNAMWDWMYALKQLPELRSSGNHEETMKYLGRETVRIADVKTRMLRSIEDARIFVNQHLNIPKE